MSVEIDTEILAELAKKIKGIGHANLNAEITEVIQRLLFSVRALEEMVVVLDEKIGDAESALVDMDNRVALLEDQNQE